MNAGQLHLAPDPVEGDDGLRDSPVVALSGGQRLLYAELGSEPLSVREAADRAGLFVCAASRHTLALIDAGLVLRTEHGLVRR